MNSRLNSTDKLEVVKYCNKNIEILLAMKQEVNNRLLDLIHSGVVDYETYDKIINVRLWGLEQMLKERYELTTARKLWRYASRRMLSIETVRLNQFRSAKKIAVNYLGRQQFYRQNGLPVELNLMIEEEIELEERNAGFVDKVIFYALEKTGLIGPMGERDVWYYGEDFRLNNDAPEELKKNIYDAILIPCKQRQRGSSYDLEHTAQQYSHHFSCLRSPEELKQFANQMLEIIERAAVRRNSTQPAEQTNPEQENSEEQAEDNNQQTENQNPNQSNNSLVEENNVSENQTYQTVNNLENSSNNASCFYSLSESSFISPSETYVSEEKSPGNHSPTNSPSSRTENPSFPSSSGPVHTGGFTIPSGGGSSPTSSPSKPKSEPTPNQPTKSEPKPTFQQPQETSNLTNLKELNKQKQQIINQIQAKLEQTPNLNLPELTNWKQEVEQMQSIEALTAYQKNLLEKLEKEKQSLMTKQVISNLETKHNKNNTAPLIIAGIIIFAIISWLTILIVRKNINKKKQYYRIRTRFNSIKRKV
jgi:hypothetical protein